jgi:hypothetical protein
VAPAGMHQGTTAAARDVRNRGIPEQLRNAKDPLALSGELWLQSLWKVMGLFHQSAPGSLTKVDTLFDTLTQTLAGTPWRSLTLVLQRSRSFGTL